MTTALTIGTLDLPHWGHVRLVQRMREMVGPDGNVIVAVNTDEFVERFKGHAPVMPQRERMAIIREFRSVDHVVSNMGDEDGGQVIEWIKPDLLVIGDDWAPPRDYHSQLGITPEWLTARWITLTFLPRTENVSTTALREKMHASGSSDR